MNSVKKNNGTFGERGEGGGASYGFQDFVILMGKYVKGLLDDKQSWKHA